ncbi:helix-turn-helix domain-containing protein [Enemella sp. A6]|uniref:helix-turn-helix domain-containing protein n=1 Tax=Enemella sp. A6 TaxID=3440152 RepID=UPI003EBD03E4
MAETRAGSSLGELLRKQRELASIPMRQLARMAGISGPYLSQIERGLRAPSDQVLEALATNLQISADALRAQAGVSATRAGTAAVVDAIRADTALTAAQRKSLEEVYLAFLATNEAGD